MTESVSRLRPGHVAGRCEWDLRGQALCWESPGHSSALQGSLTPTRRSLVTVFSLRKVIVLGLESRYSGSTVLVQYVQDVDRITKPVLP